MTAEIVLYKGTNQTYFGRLSMDPILRELLSRHVDTSDPKIRFALVFHRAAEAVADGSQLVNLLPTVTEVDVVMLRGSKMVARTRGSVAELFGPVIQRLVGRIDPDEDSWAFRISHPVLDGSGEQRRPPKVEGAIDVDLDTARPLPFSVSRLDEPGMETVDPAELGLDPAELSTINVLLPARARRMLVADLPLSRQVEEGGFFLGRIRTVDGDVPRYLVEITDVTPAEGSGAGSGHFTFTSDSFSAVNRLLAERGKDEVLAGWYHTHLFSATRRMGLSDVDVDTHFSTFRRPWQVAGLLNLTDDERVLRCYGRVADAMKECKLWVCDDGDRYRGAGTRLERE
ncbi:hypothetical protein DMA12_21115 [Amycolatopsis balhimycina DSM 5908]|uniref:JAB-N domain-containing protein n=1 Tax=Amycolatopsis balhimycina DSM 5908 TaxID=1081091 RepID=A0A428WI60_AMYBA|nr:JAB N-terminal domain-containing protein [Amycolatopsis balhimycina]RSM42722.1 hypothetical protein DMA12_21115 [Amycolatopsis balhimycina DSM 5908]